MAQRCGERDDTLPPGYRLKDMVSLAWVTKKSSCYATADCVCAFSVSPSSFQILSLSPCCLLSEHLSKDFINCNGLRITLLLPLGKEDACWTTWEAQGSFQGKDVLLTSQPSCSCHSQVEKLRTSYILFLILL